MNLNQSYHKKRLTRYLEGKGIEIGALNNPLQVNKNKANVIYVDRKEINILQELNPETNKNDILCPHVVCDAEDLNIFSDESLDFVIACQVVEHIPNPIKALLEFHRVMKENAILYISLPDKRLSMDHERPITPLNHIIQDYKNNVRINDCTDHFIEWLELVELKKDKPIASTLEEIKKHTIHFHVWDPDSMVEIFNYLNNNHNVNLVLKDYFYKKGSLEIIFILEKLKAKQKEVNIPIPLKEINLLYKILFLLFDKINTIKYILIKPD